MPHQTLMTVDNLQYSYGDRKAVDGISFHVQQGEIFGLLGPNGAGKTTTISCLAGLLSDWRGNQTFLGEPFNAGRRAADRRRLGFVPQELALYPKLTASENLHFFCKTSRVAAADRARVVDRNLELAGLSDRRNDRVEAFSGGMKRRLNLAAGLLHSPALILLDEPTAGIDPQSRNHIFDTLLQLRDRGHSLLYTTHYMEEAQRLCDRVAIMNEGRIVSIGTTQQLAAESGDPNANLEQVFLQLTGRNLRDED
jgi:ABC-2 type transport system ATP-binding protein